MYMYAKNHLLGMSRNNGKSILYQSYPMHAHKWKPFKQSPTKTKLAMVQAANQSLRIECDIMLRHPGEKMYSTYFLKGQ